jgi:undecaprenyl-diphosphatase
VWLGIALVLALLQRRPALFVAVAAADGVADALASGLKAVIPRRRPHLDHLVALPHSHSFPSGHASTSFACATVLAGLAPKLAVPAFVLAAAIAYSRLYNGVHYPLDVVGGALLGVAVGLAVRSLLQRAARRPGSGRGWRAG